MGNCCCTPNDFLFQTDTAQSGQSHVKLFQPLPVPFPKLVQNEQLLIKLLTANGVQDIKSIEVQAELPGGLNGLNRLGKIHFTSDRKPIKVVIKGNKGGFMARITWQLREAWFYERLAPAIQSNYGLRCPNTLLNMIDTSNGTQLVVMEMLDDCVEVHKIFDAYRTHGNLQSMSELQNSLMSMGTVMEQIADQISCLHLAHWMDKQLLEKATSMFATGTFRLGKDKKAFERLQKEYNNGLWLGTNCCTSLFKKFPNGAKATKNAMEKCTWEGYQKMYNSQTAFYCLLHGDFHPKQMLWSKKDQQINIIDFEFADLGHPGVDLGYFLVICGKEIRRQFMDSFLERYYSNLIASGKVTKTVYSYEQFYKDVIAHATARLSTLELAFSYFPTSDKEYVEFIIQNFDEFVQEHPETIEQDMPMLFIAPTFSMPLSEPQY